MGKSLKVSKPISSYISSKPLIFYVSNLEVHYCGSGGVVKHWFANGGSKLGERVSCVSVISSEDKMERVESQERELSYTKLCVNVYLFILV